MDGVGKADRAQELAARFGDDADGRKVADVRAGGVDQEAVHRGVEERVIRHVVDVPVVIVVHPARRNGTDHLEVFPMRRGRGVARSLRTAYAHAAPWQQTVAQATADPRRLDPQAACAVFPSPSGTCPGTSESRVSALGAARCFQAHPWVNAALELQIAAAADPFAVNSSRRNEIVRIERRGRALRSHVWNVGQLVEQLGPGRHRTPRPP